ncbi:MAG TPA: hypothetical protein VGN56_00855 [Candidatus Paceibacterota bacterium]|jgi:hypothetical protein|nr:hypothetical protein [Candidatus Paceibacterota bacterium]
MSIAPHAARRGYVAVVSALMIAASLAALVIAASTDVYTARLAVAGYADHIDARHRAISCLNAAAYALSADSAYRVPPGGLAVYLADMAHQCRIDAIGTASDAFQVSASASAEGSTVHVQGILPFPEGTSALQLASWREVN